MSDQCQSVYVVDDDASVRESVEGLIRTAGLRVESFASPQEFLNRCCSKLPSCLVLDMKLPGMSGLEVQGELAKADVHVLYRPWQHRVDSVSHELKPGESKDDHPARVRPREHRREGLVDLLERVGAGHQLVELQPTGAIERKEARNVSVDVGAPVPRANQALLHQRQHENIERDRIFDAAQPDHHAGTRLAGCSVSLLDRLLATDRFKSVVHAALFGQLADGFHRIYLARVDQVRRSESAGHFELFRLRVDGDDSFRAGKERSLNRVQPNSARAEDRHAAAGRHLGGVEHRADAGHHRAAEQSTFVQGSIVGQLDRRIGWNDGGFRHRAEYRKYVELLPILMRAAGAVGHSVGLIDPLADLAELRLADPAVETTEARRHPGEDDLVADGEPVDALANLLHRACSLVAKNTRQLPTQNPMHEREIGMADSRRREAHANLIAPRGIKDHLLDPHGLVSFVANSRFHRDSFIPPKIAAASPRRAVIPRALGGAPVDPGPLPSRSRFHRPRRLIRAKWHARHCRQRTNRARANQSGSSDAARTVAALPGYLNHLSRPRISPPGCAAV